MDDPASAARRIRRLTWRERIILADITDNLSASDPALAEQLTDTDLAEQAAAPPTWAVHVSRAGIVVMALVLVTPFAVWSGLVVLTVATLLYKMLRTRTSGQHLARNGDDDP